jgi:hypothetical protein
LAWHVFPVYGIHSGNCTCGGLKSCKGSNNAGKHPIHNGGKNTATTSIPQIKRWFRQHPSANLALNCSASGVVIVDIDPRNGGDNTWRRLQKEAGVRQSPVVALTGGGGEHHFYGAPPGLWKPISAEHRPGIDIQFNAYVVLPPSLHRSGASYTWKPECDPFSQDIDLLGLPSLPDFFIVSSNADENGSDRSTPAVNDLMSEGSASERLNGMALANIPLWAPELYPDGYWSSGGSWRIESDTLGRGYEEALSIHPQGIRDHGPEVGLTPIGLLRRDFRLVNGEVEPVDVEDWEEESRHPKGMTTEEAEEWLACQVGVDLDAMRSEVVERMFRDEASDDELGAKVETQDRLRENRPIKATPFKWADPATLPRRQWLYGTTYIRRFLSVTVAAGAVGKTALLISEALAMATGRDLLGDGECQRSPMKVWLINLEDPYEELQLRIAAAMIYHGINPIELGDRLFIGSGRDTPLVIAHETKEGVKVAEPIVEAVIAEIRENDIDVFIVDPFVSSHAVSENDNKKIDTVAKTWGRIAEATNAAIHLAHHIRKGGPGQSELTIDDSRGAKALTDAARSGRTVGRMSKKEGEALGIKEQELWRYVRVDDPKNNLAPPVRARWRRLASVVLPNGESVGAVDGWKAPQAVCDISPEDETRIAVAIRDGEWREDVRASAWVGYAFARTLGLELDNQFVRASIKDIITSWRSKGWLDIEVRPDKNREMRQFIILGSNAPIFV